jgi:hypothetical protein
MCHWRARCAAGPDITVVWGRGCVGPALRLFGSRRLVGTWRVGRGEYREGFCVGGCVRGRCVLVWCGADGLCVGR